MREQYLRPILSCVTRIILLASFVVFCSVGSSGQESQNSSNEYDGVFVFASIDIDYYLDGDAYGVAISDWQDDGPYTFWLDMEFSLSQNNMTTFITDEVGDEQVEYGYDFAANSGTTYAVTVDGELCTEAFGGTGYCGLLGADTTASVTTPGSGSGGGPGGGGTGTIPPPEIDSESLVSGNIGDTDVPVSLYGLYLAPPDNSTTVGADPGSLYFSGSPISDREIDGSYTISCAAESTVGDFTVSTNGGRAVGPDFTIESPTIGGINAPGWPTATWCGRRLTAASRAWTR